MSEIGCERVASDEFLERYVAGALGADDRDRLERHLLLCDRCQREARLALAVRHELARERKQMHRPSGRWIAAGIGTAAAAVLLALLIPQVVLEREVDTHRDVPAVDTVRPIPLAPIGPVTGRPSTLIWSRVAGADRYRVSVLSAGGDVLLEAETADTALAVPDGTKLDSEGSFFWKVDARIGWDRWVKSPVVEFAIETARFENEPSDR
jgi:hypothetical protein